MLVILLQLRSNQHHFLSYISFWLESAQLNDHSLFFFNLKNSSYLHHVIQSNVFHNLSRNDTVFMKTSHHIMLLLYCSALLLLIRAPHPTGTVLTPGEELTSFSLLLTILSPPQACKSMCMWVLAMDSYSHVFRTVEPKRAK